MRRLNMVSRILSSAVAGLMLSWSTTVYAQGTVALNCQVQSGPGEIPVSFGIVVDLAKGTVLRNASVYPAIINDQVIRWNEASNEIYIDRFAGQIILTTKGISFTGKCVSIKNRLF